MRHFVLFGLCLVTACATPVPPSGGPRDETPPHIVESLPEAGAVDVDGQTLRITFSEYIDQASFAQAFSITPSFASQPDFAWRRHAVEIEFPEPLRENTTYVVTLDTRLRDIRGAALSGPITFAFSTGPTISGGTIAGQVVTENSGRAAAGADVFAYAIDDASPLVSLPERPAYRTQTDQAGAFRFDYLTEQAYFVAALRDQNRNFQPDVQEPFAPPPVPAIMADTTPVDIGLPWVLTTVDTTRPAPTRAVSMSQSRHRLRFSEAVQFVDRDHSTWTLLDSAAAENVPIEDAYLHIDNPREVYFTTPALAATPHAVTPAALVDSSGNVVASDPTVFTPSSEPDTLQLRFLRFLPSGENTLAPGVEPGLRFNAPISQETLADAVFVQDSTGQPLAFSAVTENGTEYMILPEPPLSPGTGVQIGVRGERLANVDSTFMMTFDRVPTSEMGELSGTVIADEGRVLVQASAQDVPIAVPHVDVRTDSAGLFVIRNLPAGTYLLRAFVDEDEDGAWDGGRLTPYQAPEPIIWRNEPARVRARWETSLPDTLRIPSPETLQTVQP